MGKKSKRVLERKIFFVSHLLFVDHVLLFFYSDEMNLKKDQNILDLFSVGTWMDIYYLRCSYFCHNMHRGLLVEMNNFFPFERVDLHVGFKYLAYFLKPNNYTK